MAEAAEESGKENFLSGRSDGGMFQRQIEEPPQDGKRLKRKIPRRQAAAGPVGERFQRNTESLRNICNIGLVVAATCVLLVAVLLGMAGLNA